MKRFFLYSLLLLAGATNLLAQQGSLKTGFDTDKYPEVSFVWHELNPAVIPAAEFALEEGAVATNISVQQMAQVDMPKHQSLIVLWEDMASQGAHMHDFSQRILLDFFPTLQASDEVLLAVFNRHTPGENVMRPLTDGFTSNRQDLINAVSSHQHSTATYRDRPLESDVFPAVNEALQTLQKRDKEGYAKSIVVITSGMPLENSATNSVVSVQQLALQYHIPIYVVQYASNHGPSTKVEGLANDTYGMNVTCVSANHSDNVEKGKQALRDFYSVIPARYAGQDYRITFTTRSPRGHQEQMLKLTVAGFEYQQTFVTPSHTFASWVKAHVVLFILLVVLALLLIGATIFYIIYVKRKHEREIGNVINLQNEQMQQAEDKIKHQQQELAAYKMQQEEQVQREKAQQEIERLTQLMHSRNLYPRLQFIVNGETQSYEIHQLETVIGRTANQADVVISDATVSRRHALIVFDGEHFLISDCNSTNGTIVDGVPVTQPTPLRDHSLINLGSILINFNL